jgi:hypothetical protein
MTTKQAAIRGTVIPYRMQDGDWTPPISHATMAERLVLFHPCRCTVWQTITRLHGLPLRDTPHDILMPR